MLRTTMLRALTIRDYVILDDLNLAFADGFSVITGETGAGKSLLVDVLGLLLGGRADGTPAAPGARQAELSALFELADDHPALAWLKAQSLEEDNDCLLRRVLPAEGASKGWINGRPATMGQLRELGALLVEIHGQHEHQRLTDSGSQLHWLDTQIQSKALQMVRKATDRWREAQRALAELEETAGGAHDGDFLAFQYRELADLALAEGEYAELETEQRRLSRTSDLLAACATVLTALDGSENGADGAGVRGRLHHCITTLEAVADLEPRLAEITQILRESSINIDEAVAGLERQSAHIEADPERLAEVDHRLGETLSLARKHRVQPDELPALTETLRDRITRLENLEAERARCQTLLEQAHSEWLQAAQALSRVRSARATELAQDIHRHLAQLGMSDARVVIRVDPDPQTRVGDSGMDRVEILFSANPGQPPQPLRKIASGGELSRFSLAMIAATITTGHGQIRVFDEVDAGVGGETAHAVGKFLHDVARGGQAFCVTHLAQVAARADHHLRVVKQGEETRTKTTVEPLDADQRQREIARMLGSSDSDRGLAHAEELLAVRDRSAGANRDQRRGRT